MGVTWGEVRLEKVHVGEAGLDAVSVLPQHVRLVCGEDASGVSASEFGVSVVGCQFSVSRFSSLGIRVKGSLHMQLGMLCVSFCPTPTLRSTLQFARWFEG